MEKIYGINTISLLLKHNAQIVQQIWYAVGNSNVRITELLEIARSKGITISPRPKTELDKITDYANHQNLIATIIPAEIKSENTLTKIIQDTTTAPLILALDGITDPHNLGACLRSAAAFGVNAVIIPKDKSATLNATVRKVASGAADLVPVIAVTNLARCFDNLRKSGLWIFGAAGEATQSIYQQDLSCPLVMVMGSEGKGLRRLTREKCDYLVNIPIDNTIASLNVSVATGICLSEITRQRTITS